MAVCSMWHLAAGARYAAPCRDAYQINAIILLWVWCKRALEADDGEF